MPDFKNGIIYKIWNPDIPEQAYYGSTAHKYYRKRYSRAKAYERTNPLKRFGNIFTTDNHIFSIIEKYPCSNDYELKYREQHYISNYPDSINIKNSIKGLKTRKKNITNSI